MFTLCLLGNEDDNDVEEGGGGEGGVAPRPRMFTGVEMKYEEFCRTACKWAAWCSCTFNVFGGVMVLVTGDGCGDGGSG